MWSGEVAMRIAVSGTHCSGKSTLVEDFAAAHPDYVLEPEPYEWLDDAGEEPGVDEFFRQLEISVERLQAYPPGARVIAERSPLDFVAYLLALGDLRRGERASDVIDSAIELAASGMRHVDLLVVLPGDEIDAPDDEDPELREAMNERLLELVGAEPRVLELRGSPRERLAMLEQAAT